MNSESATDPPLTGEIDLTPNVEYLVALANSNHDHWKLIAEAVDNSFDAQATIVTVGFHTRGKNTRIEITDNGCGCEDLSVMLRLAGREQHRGTKLGRYGIGLKEAIHWWGGAKPSVYIRSTHGGRRRTIEVSFAEMAKTNRWSVNASPTNNPAQEGEVGTYIRIQPFVKRLPNLGADWDAVLARIGYLYAPALKGGRSIILRRDGVDFPVRKWEPPAFSEHIKAEVVVDGRKATVVAGIVKPGEANRRPGLTYWHGFRVIIEATQKGCGTVRNLSNFCGFVELGEGWVLTKNKDNISDREEDLFKAVYPVIASLLEKAEQSSHLLELEGVRIAAEKIANKSLGLSDENDAKAKRGGAKGEDPGTKEPTGKGTKHKQAEKEQKGSSFRGKRMHRGKLTICFAHLGADEVKPVQVDTRSGTINLNSDHPAIQEIRHDEVGVARFAVWAWACISAFPPSEQTSFGGDADKIFEQLGRLLGKTMTMNGHTVGVGADGAAQVEGSVS
jgi:hypothetical protein